MEFVVLRIIAEQDAQFRVKKCDHVKHMMICCIDGRHCMTVQCFVMTREFMGLVVSRGGPPRSGLAA